jgi:hypothetical protein
LLRAKSSARTTLALVVPQAPGLENAARTALIDDALSTGLLRAGAHVARVREFTPAGELTEHEEHYSEAVSALLAAALPVAPASRPAIVGSWLAGAAAAAASAHHEDLAFLALISAPTPEVMCRRTPENEDDPMWQTSPALRLSEALARLAPLEAITAHRRPVLLVNGAVDTALAATHLEAWRSVLAFTGRPVDAVELAFADALFQAVAPDGGVEDDSGQALDLLAGVVMRWCAAR